MKIKHTGVKYVGNYHFGPDEVKDIPEKEARRLLADFPDRFVAVDETKKEMTGTHNRAMKGKQTK